jgi:cation diffusion facilitator CzcD-associated flavoprotein CzcO
MLQRSPSYVVSLPSRDRLAKGLGARLTRAKNVAIGMYFYNRARRKPEKARNLLIDLVRAELPEGYDVERHFAPSYKPWDQRMCVVPDGDLFAALRDGRVSIETGEIETFTPRGMRLRSGADIEADIVVTATGLVVKLLGGVALDVDGEPAEAAGRLVYKGMMLEDIPNLAFSFGYTNASWTLKCDLTSRYLCRLLRHMDRRGHRICTPRVCGEVERRPLLDFTSGYIARAGDILPKQGTQKPWRVPQNYFRDLATLGFGSVEDEAMEFR